MKSAETHLPNIFNHLHSGVSTNWEGLILHVKEQGLELLDYKPLEKQASPTKNF